MLKIFLHVNGHRHELALPASTTLLEALRGPLDLTGAKPACDMGECGACAVLVDGVPTLACLALAAEVEGQTVITVEGLARGGELHPMQRAFHEAGAAQCGYCTPGFLITAAALMDVHPTPDEAAVTQALSGNLCRCTGYTAIVAAVIRALREGGPAPSAEEAP